MRDLEAAPARLQLASSPTEPAAAFAYDGVVPGPLIRLRQGEELGLRFSNTLAEPTTLSFPGLRAVNSAAGIGGLTQERLKSGATAEIRFVPPDSGFNLSAACRLNRRQPARARAVRTDHRTRQAKAADVDLDTTVILSDWNVDSSGQIKNDFADPAIGRERGRKGGVVFANAARPPLKLGARPGARCASASGNAATGRRGLLRISGAKTFIVAVDGQPGEHSNLSTVNFPMGTGRLTN